MMQYKYLILLLGVTLGIKTVFAEIDVNAEINRIEQQMSQMKPAPELIGNILEQLQKHCKRNTTLDHSLYANASKCVEQHMNETQLISDIKQAVPQGKLDNVFHDMCVKWPKVRDCLSDIFKIIDQCWDKGDQVNKVVDESIKFFCGDDNDGARIALFLAEGGMECLEKHGDSVKTCVEKKRQIPEEIPEMPLALPNKDEICEALNELKDCTSVGLKKCKDPTPENLASSMIRYVGRAVDCRMKEEVRTSKSASTSEATAVTSVSAGYLGWLLLTGAGSFLL